MRDYRRVVMNQSCPASQADYDKNCDVYIFANFTASVVPFGDIWHEYSEYVDFRFAICTRCSTIHAFIHCT